MPHEGIILRRALFAVGLVSLAWMTAAPAARAQGLPLYTVSGDNQLRSVDPLTGRTLSTVTIALGGLKVEGATGLARHPETGELFVLLEVAGQRGSELAKIDPASGTAMRIGNTGEPFRGLAFDDEGRLYAFRAATASSRRALFRLDPGSAAATRADQSGAARSPAPEGFSVTAHWRGDFSLQATPDGSLFLLRPDAAPGRLSTLDHAATGLAFAGAAPACSPLPALFGAASADSGGPSFFYSIDGVSGAATLVGPVGFDHVTAMDFGPANTLYAAGEHPDNHQSVLLSVDLCSGLGNAVGSTGLQSGETIADLAYRKSDRTLFAYIEPGHELATVDLSTGALDRLGTVFSPSGSGDGIAARADGTLVHAAGSVLTLLNPANLTETTLAPLGFPDAESSLRVVALDFSSQGELLALLEVNGGSFLGTIDPLSGEVMSVVPTQVGLVALAAATIDPDLILSMSDAPDPVGVGVNVTYTLTVANAGPEAATGVILTDTLPGGTTFGSTATSQGTCSQSMGVVTCALGTINAQSTATVTIVAATPGTAGTITNTANVTLNEFDPNLANNSASAMTDVVDFQISVMPASVTVTRGNTAVYTVTLTPVGGRFDFVITLDCEMEPTATTCIFSPSGATPGGGAINATLSLRTTAPSTAANQTTSLSPIYAVWLLAPLGLLAIVAGRRKRTIVLLAVLFLMLSLQAGCGGGSSEMPMTNPGTPLGTHTFTVRGIVGTLQHSTTVMVVVQ